MENIESSNDRTAIIDRVFRTPPKVHPGAPDGEVWRTSRDCYEFIAGLVGPGSRTLETGAGLSTVFFAAWGCDHLAVVPFPSEASVIEDYCQENGIETSALAFDLRPSEIALPELRNSGELDLVFIDGSHGFPIPIIDWFYGGGRLRRGGVVVFDDVQLPQVVSFLEMFIEPDDRWQPLKATPKWRAYRRLSEGSPAEDWWAQQSFFPKPKVALQSQLLRKLKDAIPPGARKKLARFRS